MMAGYDGLGYDGHSGSNDDLFGPAPPTGPGGQPAAYQPHGDQRSNTLDRTTFGGQATRYGQDGTVYQSSGQQAAQRYTSLGQAAAARGAYQNDWAQANASRGQQGTALGYMQNAAAGGAPSQAQLLGRNMIDQSLNAQMAAAASARGGSLAQAAAMRNAANMGDAARQQGMNQLSALRAQEMAHARDAYMQGASGMRGQDIGQQGMNLQSELAQRQLNQQGQQFYDQMGWNTTRADQEAAMHQASIDSQEYLAQKQMNQHSTDRETGVTSSIIGGVGSALGSIFSDVTAKTNLEPVGGIIRQNPYGAPVSAPASGPSMMGRLGGAMSSGFGSFQNGMKPMMLSDANAKREAFEDGAKYETATRAAAQGLKVHPDHLRPPTYMLKRNPAAGPVTDPAAEQAHAARVAQAQVQPPPAVQAAPVEVAPKLAQVAVQPKPLPIALAARAVPAMPVLSDDRSKVIDLDEQSFDADEYLESKAPKPMEWEALHMQRDTPQDQARVKRGVEDKAGRDADAMMAGYGAALAKGPATEEAMARANRSMAGSSYAYKPEFTPPDQVPGEKNVGPMAQNMAADPVASTAVKQDPASGMLMLDGQKMLKLNAAGVASLQRQVDSLAAAVAKRGRKS